LQFCLIKINWNDAKPTRIARIHRIAPGIFVHIEPAVCADGVGLQESPTGLRRCRLRGAVGAGFVVHEAEFGEAHLAGVAEAAGHGEAFLAPRPVGICGSRGAARIGGGDDAAARISHQPFARAPFIHHDRLVSAGAVDGAAEQGACAVIFADHRGAVPGSRATRCPGQVPKKFVVPTPVVVCATRSSAPQCMLANNACNIMRVSYKCRVNSRHTKTLQAVFRQPTQASLAWADIEALLVAAGCEVIEGAGSRVRFVCRNVVASFHRPHPAKEAKRYQVRDARDYLIKLGVEP
jgi:hypothetical protein